MDRAVKSFGQAFSKACGFQRQSLWKENVTLLLHGFKMRVPPPPFNPTLKYSVRLRTEYLGTAQDNFPKEQMWAPSCGRFFGSFFAAIFAKKRTKRRVIAIFTGAFGDPNPFQKLLAAQKCLLRRKNKKRTRREGNAPFPCLRVRLVYSAVCSLSVTMKPSAPLPWIL